ncbi:FHA domain-containing protein [Sodalis sp. dw_96]|uniref:FHA domain-containing protein n=1 Tax=Sodalis sp. dw_96 TaxID=2719794 RepID=UPI001BD48380|nr:FHA domain-containing protein [Sodalis sp. dw_96]
MYELRVLSGLHRGAALPLSGGEWLIGRSDEADLQLTDEGIEECHCRLSKEGERWHLQSGQGGARDSRGAVVGGIDDIRPEQPFAVGDVWLGIAGAETPWREMNPPPHARAAVAVPEKNNPPVSSGLPRWMRVLMVSLLLLFSFTVVSWILQPGMAQTTTADTDIQRGRLATADAVCAALLSMLRERDLVDSVRVVNAEGAVILSGELSATQLAVLKRMMTRFYALYDVIPPLRDRTTTLSVKLPFRIVQITMGAHANVVTDRGQRLFIGDEVDDLRLVAITSTQVEFNGREHIMANW